MSKTETLMNKLRKLSSVNGLTNEEWEDCYQPWPEFIHIREYIGDNFCQCCGQRNDTGHKSYCTEGKIYEHPYFN